MGIVEASWLKLFPMAFAILQLAIGSVLIWTVLYSVGSESV